MEAESATAGVPEAVRPGMQVVLEEVVANVARHGFPSGGTGEIEVSLTPDEAGFALVVRDNGAAFDPTKAPPRVRAASLLDDAVGGWGLGLIRHFCQDILYARQDGRNALTLRFARTPPEPGGADVTGV
jgi:anti-sigma regulatory factor (Ser/Thr protein kinase)